MTPADVVLGMADLGWAVSTDVGTPGTWDAGASWIAHRRRREVCAHYIDAGIPRWIWSVWDGDHYVARGEDIDAEVAAADLLAVVERITGTRRG